MDEQRMLEEMERRLADDDPLLASRLTSFGHPGLTALMRSPRARLLTALVALAVIAVVAVAFYAVGPFRQGAARPSPARSSVPHGVQLPPPRGSVTGQPVILAP
ncbi:MAG TPA: DUF3040 domain-containing protein [Streptosporangiaceae bacterium]